MNRHAIPTRSLALTALCTMLAVHAATAAAPATPPAEGIRNNTPAVHALVGARVVVAPGRVIERGVVVIRDGVIDVVKSHPQDDAPVNGDIPADARIWQLDGKTIYPGLIDAYSELSAADAKRAAAESASSHGAAGYWNGNVVPQIRADRLYRVNAPVNEKYRSQGITARLVAPPAGMIRGTSCVVTTGDVGGSQAIVKDVVAMHMKLTVTRGQNRDQYPNSPMGAVALVRQALYDADWYAQAWRAYRAGGGLPRPEQNTALDALAGYRAGELPVIVDAASEIYFLRADRVGKEFALQVIVRGSGREYRRLDAIRASGRPVIVPVRFPKAPNVATREAAADVSLESLMHWDLAPENPARLDAAGVAFALTSHGLEDKGDLLKQVRRAVERGLSPDAALKALTTSPATLLGVDKQLGAVEPGKLAHLVVSDGDLFAKDTKVVETWVDGKRYEVTPASPIDVRGQWEVTAERHEGDPETFTLVLRGEPAKLAGRAKKGDGQVKLTQLVLQDARLSFLLNGKKLGLEGMVRISGFVAQDAESEMRWLGSVTWADESVLPCRAKRTSTEVPAAEGDQDAEDKKEDDRDAGGSSDEAPSTPDPELQKALYAVNYPLGAFGRAAPPDQPAVVVLTNATVWTCAPQGTIEGATVLIRAGKIEAVGQEIAVPEGALVVDATGKHVSPGIIDCHSHIASDGGINESGQAITAEVRIGDFIDPNDISIYRQLAGGVTTSNILHGSANPIGGQNQVIKFRWGALPEAMKMARAPAGIKFALGENVKQSNWGDKYTERYPQSRMGVEQIIRDAFSAAEDYRKQWQTWRDTSEGLPPRVNLELEALAEVVEGKRLIHCHAYRQDEMLALMRTCEDFGIRIGTFQHVLEGYKIAAEMARHGVMGSSFSDWWAYKFEVYDAIPYNGALMHNAGVVVSFNSDDAELGRRLNGEAAKAVKYGRVPPEEALKFVTLNTARQLRIDAFVGSIEAGKDADLVVWNGSPLSTLSRCEQTWVDGRKYFDIEEDRKQQAAVRQMRAALVQRILASGEEMRKEGDEAEDELQLWPREDIFCGHSDHGAAHQ